VGITEQIDKKVFRMPLESMLRDKKYLRLYEIQGEELLYRKAIDRNSTDDDDVVQLIKRSVDHIMTTKHLQDETSQKKFTAGICGAMMAIDRDTLRTQRLPISAFLEDTPTVATATGDLAMLQRTVTKIEDLFDRPDGLLPSAICTAASCNDVLGLKWQLTYLIRELKYKKRPKYSQLLTEALKEVTAALRIAIRRNQAVTGDVLFAGLEKLRSMMHKTNIHNSSCYSRLCRDWAGIYKDAIRYDNVELVCRALSEANSVWSGSGQDTSQQYVFNVKDVNFLLRFGTMRMFTKLLTTGYLDPNRVHNGRNLVANALRCRRRGLAQVLLDYSADINSVGNDEGVTALWYAAEGGFCQDVLFLLQNGADPNFPDDLFKSPIQRAGTKRFSKTLFLRRYGMNRKGRAQLREQGSEILKQYGKAR
jgi:hypothetical protein